MASAVFLWAAAALLGRAARAAWEPSRRPHRLAAVRSSQWWPNGSAKRPWRSPYHWSAAGAISMAACSIAWRAIGPGPDAKAARTIDETATEG